MVWSKTKQQLEGFLCPDLLGRVEYRATSYRYLPDKAGQSYITVDKKEIFNMNDVTTMIRWYKTEHEIKNDPYLQISISDNDIEAVRKDTGGRVPEERLTVIARKQKLSVYAVEILGAQAMLCKTNFFSAANTFLTSSIEDSLKSKDILLNVFALVDRRVGKKRILNLESDIKLKHPIVQYFYELRR